MSDIAIALQYHPGTHVLPLGMLSPINNVMEPTFYDFVYTSVAAHGLYNPLVVAPLTREQWKEKAKLHEDFISPRSPEDIDHYAIVCGCNRYFALLEQGFKYVECIFIEDWEEARDQCHKLAVDKRWQRGSNFDLLGEQKIGKQ